MIANLKHAARNSETVSVGGGEFSPAEIREFVARYESTIAALEEIERWMSGYGSKTQSEMRRDVRAALAFAKTTT